MRKRMSILAAALVLVSAGACGRQVAAESEPAPVAAARIDPTGMYDFRATHGGQTRTGTLEIRRTANGLDGEAWLEGEQDPAIIDSVAVAGHHVTAHATVGGGNEIVFELDFSGPGFTGVAVSGDATIQLTGTRRGS